MILQDIINTLSLPEFYFAVFRSATQVLLATLGAMIASRSGTNNIALEGTMLISAFVGVVVSAFTQSAWIGFFGAVLAGFLISNILAYFILKLNSNSVISGIALNTFASGGTIFALYLLTGEKGDFHVSGVFKAPQHRHPGDPGHPGHRSHPFRPSCADVCGSDPGGCNLVHV